MTAFSELAARLAREEATLTAWIGWPEPAIAAALARAGFDAVTIDMQHGTVDFPDVVRALPLIAAAGRPAIVRVPVGDFATASRCLDAGASGIIAPMVNSADDARTLVRFTKFPPVGERSWGPNAALTASGLDGGAYLSAANALCRTLAMVETREALAALDDILAVDGVDGIFVGPSDLSLALSGGAKLDPASAEVDAALKLVVARCRATGKAPCVYASTAARAAELARMGFRLIAIGSDASLLSAGAREALRTARG